MTHLILLGSMRSMSLSFFQKSCGGGEASTLHSNLTVSPSRALELIIFWTKVGGRRTTWAAHNSLGWWTNRITTACTTCDHQSWWNYGSGTSVLPMTLSLTVNRLSPARFLATHSYTPAWCTVTISMMNECIPFSHTSILWKSSGRMALPSKYQDTSGVGRPPT